MPETLLGCAGIVKPNYQVAPTVATKEDKKQDKGDVKNNVKGGDKKRGEVDDKWKDSELDLL